MEQEFESILEAYPVRLTNFEGPLDLLLHLIKTNEVNIYDIPIALITSQYIDYIDLMRDMNLDMAGEFLVMAATLIHIKSRMLLPRPDPAQEEPEEDPREALMRRLLEHQKFKAAAELLHERETLRSAQWTRADGPIAEIAGEAPEPEIEVDLFSLISAFRAVVERAKQRPKIYLPGEQMPIEDRIEQLLARLSETEACGFEDLFADMQSRSGMIVTFLAILEMIRLKLIRVFQTGGFTAFITWSYQPEHTELGGGEATGVDYLRTLALARIVLDNFDNLQASWVTQGGKVGQLSLAYGANDMGSVMIEENVVRAAGASYCMDEIEIVRNVENAGFTALRRNMHYEVLGEPIFREREVPRMLHLAVARADGDTSRPPEITRYAARTTAEKKARLNG